MHYQVQVSVFNCQQILTKISFVIIDIVVKKQIKCGLAWSVLLSTMIGVNHSGKNLLWTQGLGFRVVNRSTDHAKPHSMLLICLSQITQFTK